MAESPSETGHERLGRAALVAEMEAKGMIVDLAHVEGAIRVAVEAVEIGRDVDVEDVAVAQHDVRCRDPMTDDLVRRRADRLPAGHLHFGRSG